MLIEIMYQELVHIPQTNKRGNVMQDNNLEDVVRFLNKKTYWNSQTVPDSIKEAKEDFISSINYNSLLEDEDVENNLNEDFELLMLKYDLSEQQALAIVSSVISEKLTIPEIPRLRLPDGVKNWWDSFKRGFGFGEKPPKPDVPEVPKPTKPEAPSAPEAPPKKPTASPEAQARKQELERRRVEREQRAQQRKLDSERRRLEAERKNLNAERAKTPKQKAPEALKPKKPEVPEAPKAKKPGKIAPIVTGIGIGSIIANNDEDGENGQSSKPDPKLTPDQNREYDRKMDKPTSPGGPSSRDIHKDIEDLSKEDPEAEATKRAFANKQSSYEKTARDLLAARNKHTGIDSDIDSTINKLKKDGKESTWKNFIRIQGDENIALKVGQ